MSQTKDIRDAVENELSYDPLVDESDISVKNINGDVALNGTVPSYPQYLEAATAAWRVAGVKKLQNHLEVVVPPADDRDDATLTTAANDVLTLNVAVPDGVGAPAKDGNISLTGAVSYGAERTAAEQAVAVLAGVRNVKDDIEISTNAEATAKNGDVTLTGAVLCGAERAAAEAMIADITGVRSVTNDIQVRDDADPL
jgi:osmotically-inducible protein OsmY